MEWSLRTQVGTKGQHWDTADPGTVGMDGKTPAQYKYLNFSNIGFGNEQLYKLSWNLRLLEEDWKSLFQVVGDIYQPDNYEARLYQEAVRMRVYMDTNAINLPILTYSDDLRITQSQISVAVNDYWNTSVAEFISGKRNPDTGWAAFKQELDRLGYNRYLASMQATYDAQKK
jgi:putative aldouronate transport system substrate-binding protein